MADVPARVHYRQADDPDLSCASCRAYDAGYCSMFGADVDPSMTCDDWEPLVADHAHRIRQLNAATKAGTKRARELEPKLAAILAPILEDAGVQAAEAFTARASSHVIASARKRDVMSLAGLDITEARRVVVGLALTAAAPGVTPQSTMIAVYPRAEEAESLATGTMPAETLHITLAYLGDVSDADVLEAAKSALGTVAGTHAPLDGSVGGVGVFGDNGAGHPSILLPDVPGLVELRTAVCEALTSADTAYSKDHGFTAHLTVSYMKGPDAPDHEQIGSPLHFDEMCLVQGDEIVARFPLTGVVPLTAAGDPKWTSPAADELLDVQALVASLRTKTDPIRLALIEAVMGPTMPLTAAAETTFKLTRYTPVEVRDVEVALSDKINAWKSEEAGDLATDAITESLLGEGGDLWVLEDRASGALEAIANVEKVGELDRYAVHNIAAAGGKGAGTTLLQMVAKQAADDSMGVGVVSTEEAEGYYSKLPYWQKADAGEGVEVGGTHFELPAEDAGKFALGANRQASTDGSIFDVTNPLTAKVFAQTGSQITEISRTTQGNVMAIIKESYEQGLSIPDTAKAIKVGMKEASTVRATLIARTEMAGAVNGGSLAAVQIVDSATGGGGMHKVWLTAEGAHFPRHEEYDGLDEQQRPLEGAFEVGGASLMYPGDPDGPPEEVCNCRCTVVYVDAGGNETDSVDAG